VAVVVPLAVFAWLMASPGMNHAAELPVQHFFIVTDVSLLAAGVAFLLVRAALQMEQFRVLLLALGFMSMAGLFTVHAISTPGVLQPVPIGYSYGGSYGGTVIGVSAYLSLFVPALFFWGGYTGAAAALQRRFPRAAPGIVAAIAALLVAYGVMAFVRPELLTALPFGDPQYAYLLGIVSAVLFIFAATRQAETYARTRFPMQGALVLSFIFLAEAQVIMVVSSFWTLAWWEYHVLMFAAVVLAMGALFLELDRRRGLERFLPAEVVERVVTGDPLRLGGERRAATVLFADLRGSTVLAEQLAAEHVVRLLNTYIGALAQCVFARGGMLDKFLGDGLMAVFGVLPDGSDGAVPAVQAALDMRREIQAVNARRVADGSTPIGFGVGIHTGEVVLGAIGIPQRSDFTAIGDTVNTAARLQEICKGHDVDIILSSQTVERLPADAFALRDLGPAEVRGKSQPVRILTPV
jgi:class 3 adenylate cyclase